MIVKHKTQASLFMNFQINSKIQYAVSEDFVHCKIPFYKIKLNPTHNKVTWLYDYIGHLNNFTQEYHET